MLRHFSLRTKLTLLFLLVAALVGVTGYYEVRSINHLNGLIVNLMDHNIARRNMLGDMKDVVNQSQTEALAYAQAATDPDQAVTKANADGQQNDLRKEFDREFKTYRGLLAGDNKEISAQALTAVDTDADAVFAANLAYITAVDTKAASNIRLTSRLAVGQTNAQLIKQLNTLVTAEDHGVAAEDTRIDVNVIQLNRLILFLVATVMVITVVLAVLVAARLSSSLRRLRESAARIANGDFSKKVTVKSDDEIGQLGRAFNDMSDRLRDSYRRLAAETERDVTLLESLGEGVIAIDEHTNIVLINESAVKLLELPPREKVVGVPVNHAFEVKDERDKPLKAKETPALSALKSSQPVAGIFTFHKKSGAKQLLSIAANPVVFEGKTAGAIMTVRDVTKEREVDRMKTEFISLASHQLRTPLSAIKWFTEMLLSGDAGKLSADQTEFAKNISDSTERMIALVNALLNISRIESGRIMVDPKPTDLKELVSGIITDLKGKTEEKQQTLIISVHDELPKIKLDPRLIGQVYLNLLTNAIKYTPKGGEVSVFISKKDDEIISQVTDNGYGIPKEQQGRMFQKFFRATNAVKVETDGTGLGLYLIKSIIESSGGKIWFESTEGKGTTFWFTIPLSGMKRKEGEVTLDV